MLSLLNDRHPPPPDERATQWYYLDPASRIHGPYTGQQMTKWFDFCFFTGSLRIRTGLERDFHTIDEWRLICGGYLPFRFSMVSFEDARCATVYMPGRRAGADLPKFSRMYTEPYIDPQSLVQPAHLLGKPHYEIVIDSDCDLESELEDPPPLTIQKEEMDPKEHMKHINAVLDGCEPEFCEIPPDAPYLPLPVGPPPMPPHPAVFPTTHVVPPKDPWHFDEVIFHETVPQGFNQRNERPFGRGRGRQYLDALPSQLEKKRKKTEEGEKKKDKTWNMENIELPWTLEKLSENKHMESWRITLDSEEGTPTKGKGATNPWLLPIESRLPDRPKPSPPVSRGTKTSHLVKKVDAATQTDPIVISAKALEAVLSRYFGRVEIRFDR